MNNTVQDYLDLVTSEYEEQPDFMATVAFKVSLQVQVQSLMASMIPIFDLGLPPVGNQLDIIGQWAGVSRQVAIPISGVYFTWDDVAADGWDFGIWQQVPPTTTLQALPDDVYLTLIQARIAANQWDGTTEGAYKIWSTVFPQFEILINDHCNMTYDLAIIGGIVDSLTLALITGGYIPLRPEGIEIANYYVSVDTNPAFAWDSENEFLQGWDQGSWLKVVTPT
jgi:uncharacterized protein DUF2612